MILSRSLAALAASAILTLALPVSAAPHTYQVTGPVLELTDTSVTVQKGTEKWELTRDASTKVTGDLKVGSKVTIEYTMTATTVTIKPEKAEKPAPAPKAEKPAAKATEKPAVAK